MKALLFLILIPSASLIAKTSAQAASTTLLNDPFYLLFILVAISLLPFIAVMTTSFAKIIVVLSIVRQALGTAQAPPNIVIISLSMLLTLFAMYPVITQIEVALQAQNWSHENNAESLKKLVAISKEPLRAFLSKHAKPSDRELFLDILNKNTNSAQSQVSPNDFIILAPAFLISELSHAFQIGFIIYLPFLVIDMTIANILMALGMQMLSPTTISLPFKILLFVLVDGWRLLAEGLTKG
jgi:type III secretion protein R